MRYGWSVLGLLVGHRLHFRWVNGFWCEHPQWSEGLHIDLGRRKLRACQGCGCFRLAP